VFSPWYNTEHDHTGLGPLTPYDGHHGLAEHWVAARAAELATAFRVHPERFPADLPQPAARPTEVRVNPSTTQAADEALLH
jgi:putative transposase